MENLFHTVQVETAIDKIEKSVYQYLEIMEMVKSCNVSTDTLFQKKFNAFYRVRQRAPEWYENYYHIFENAKSTDVVFADILNDIASLLHRYEPSFSSKLVATLNPEMPIWDVYVLKNCGLKPPSYTSKYKQERAILIYNELRKWYEDFLLTDNAKKIIDIFNTRIIEHNQISDLKKVDFLLWKIR